MAADEFIRRFLIHTLPPGFQRVRHFGFLANCHPTAELALCRELLIVPITDLLPQPVDCRQLLEAITENERHRCSRCGVGMMIRIAILPRYPWPAVPPRIPHEDIADSSADRRGCRHHGNLRPQCARTSASRRSPCRPPPIPTGVSLSNRG